MSDNHTAFEAIPRDGARARRFLWIFAIGVLLIAALVASVNLVSYQYMLRPDNQSIVQLLSGWGRMYKPILFDAIKPNVAVYGASWARDAFDPATSSDLLGKTLYNHAVSGGTAYETRRFGDSSLDNPDLETAIINLDTFFRDQRVARFRYGFDESILDLDADRRPNRWVGISRAYSLALTGWAVGANLELISAIRARDSGVEISEYLEAYERADQTRRQSTMNSLRQSIFEANTSVMPTDESNVLDNVDLPPELDKMLDGFCGLGIDVYAYYTPAHARQLTCDPQAREKIVALDYFRRKQKQCDARIKYFDFGYPNAVTLEGVLAPVKSSEYYRPDGHPRPTVGLLMAAKMFARDFPSATPMVVQRDFGTDLLDNANPEAWLQARAARCTGDWVASDKAALVDALSRP